VSPFGQKRYRPRRTRDFLSSPPIKCIPSMHIYRYWDLVLLPPGSQRPFLVSFPVSVAIIFSSLLCFKEQNVQVPTASFGTREFTPSRSLPYYRPGIPLTPADPTRAELLPPRRFYTKEALRGLCAVSFKSPLLSFNLRDPPPTWESFVIFLPQLTSLLSPLLLGALPAFPSELVPPDPQSRKLLKAFLFSSLYRAFLPLSHGGSGSSVSGPMRSLT